MATLDIGGRKITVDDSFLQLPPDQQSAAVEEISASLPAPVGVAEDVAKSAATGVARGGIGLAGLGGDLQEMGGKLGVSDWLTQKAQEYFPNATKFLQEESAKSQKSALGGALADQRAGDLMVNPLPTSEQIQGAVESRTGKFYEPQTTEGKFAGTIGEFAAPSLLGKGRLLQKGATALFAGGASEGAGQLTEGTAAEPYARVAGALAGGLVPGRLVKSGVPSTKQLFSEADKGYDTARALGTEYSPRALNNTVARLKADLAAKGIDETVAPKTFAILDRASSAPRGAILTFSNVENIRKTLGNAAGGIDKTENLAAVLAKNAVDDFLETPANVTRGNARLTAETAKTARGNSAAAHRANSLDKREVRAELRASAANSGQNVANTMRQRVADMLIQNKEVRGFTKDELKQAERIVRGTMTGNAARRVGNWLGGGGGAWQGLVAGGAGATAYATGDPTYLALPALGVAGKSINNASTMRQVKKLNEMLRSRAPLSQAVLATVPKKQRDRDALIKALLAAEVSGQGVRLPALGEAQK